MIGNRDGDDDVPSRPGSCVEAQDSHYYSEVLVGVRKGGG